MKTEVVRQINITLEKDEKELIKKVGTLIDDLIEIGSKNDCRRYEINDGYLYREAELEDILNFLKNLIDVGVINLT